MKTAILLLNAMLLTLVALASAARTPEEQSVVDFVNAYDRAYLASDVAFFEQNFHSDYRVFVHGERKTKADAIEWIKTKDAEERTLGLSTATDRVRIAGDMAVATGSIDYKWMDPSKANASPKHDKEHFTLVLVKDGAAWRAWSEHISKVKPAKAP